MGRKAGEPRVCPECGESWSAHNSAIKPGVGIVRSCPDPYRPTSIEEHRARRREAPVDDDPWAEDDDDAPEPGIAALFDDIEV